jgi:hypothetical protein
MGSGAGAFPEEVRLDAAGRVRALRSSVVRARMRWVTRGRHELARLLATPSVRRSASVLSLLAVRLGGVVVAPAWPRRRRAISAELRRLGDAPATTSVDVIDSSRWSDLVTSASASSCDVLCFAPFGVSDLDPGWMARMQRELGAGTVAATPTLVRPVHRCHGITEHDGLVAAAGFDIEIDRAGAPVVRARLAGERPSADGEVSEVAAAPLQGLMVDRTAYVAAGGLEGPADDLDVASVDLCARLRQHGGRIVHVPSALALDWRDVRSRRALLHPIDVTSPAWRRAVARSGPQLSRGTRTSSTPRLRLAISTAAPNQLVCRRWGDWHVAEALGRALERSGVEVLVNTSSEAASPAARSCDVHLVLRGRSPIERTPGQHHVLWVISHPETIDPAECDEADLVLVASPLFADELRTKTATPVDVLLQATDPDRFCPGPGSRRHHHDVTFVAKSRDVRRRIVADAIEAGFEPTIYGTGWQGLVDARLVRDGYVDNAYLPVIYRSAGVVLNDHWDSMRDFGFVSNRLYDVLGCGTPVVSDDVVGIPELFDGAVPTYRTPEELASVITAALEDPASARATAARGRAAVLRRHTFDHRAQELLALLSEHQLDDLGRIPLVR